MGMSRTSVTCARMVSRLKSEVEFLLRRLAMTASDVINLLFHQIRLRQVIPFEIGLPNHLTAGTLRNSRLGNGVRRFDSRKALHKDLGI